MKRPTSRRDFLELSALGPGSPELDRIGCQANFGGWVPISPIRGSARNPWLFPIACLTLQARMDSQPRPRRSL